MKSLILTSILLQAAGLWAETPQSNISSEEAACADTALELPSLLKELGADVIRPANLSKERDLIDEPCRWTLKSGRIVRSVVVRPLRDTVYEEIESDGPGVVRYLFAEKLSSVLLRAKEAKLGACEVVEGESRFFSCDVDINELPPALRATMEAVLQRERLRAANRKALHQAKISLAELDKLR